MRDSGPDLPGQLVDAFSSFLPTFGRWIEAGMRSSGTSVARIRVLDVLHCDGPLKMHEIGDRLGVTARNITALVDGLEAESLVRRVPHPSDRRATLIELTQHGDDVGRRLWGEHMARAAVIFATLPEADQRQLLHSITALRDEVERLSAAG